MNVNQNVAFSNAGAFGFNGAFAGANNKFRFNNKGLVGVALNTARLQADPDEAQRRKLIEIELKATDPELAALARKAQSEPGALDQEDWQKLGGAAVDRQNLADGTSRNNWFTKAAGAIGDGLNYLMGRSSSGVGFVDKNGDFHIRTCFTAGTLVKVHPQTNGAFLLHAKGRNGGNGHAISRFEGAQNFYKKIEDLKAGDLVLSWNEKTGQLGYEPVQQTFIRQTDKIYTIKYADGTEVETTWSHPFYVAGQGWVEAKDLRVGMKSPTANAIAKHNEQLTMAGGMKLPVQMVSFSDSPQRSGDSKASMSKAIVQLDGDLPGAVEIVGIEIDEREEEVYNFDVPVGDTYFVTEVGMLVHNGEYSGKEGKVKFRVDTDQNEYANANLKEDELRTLNKLSPDEKKKIREKLEEELRERAERYIDDQFEDFYEQNKFRCQFFGCEAERNRIAAEAENHIQSKLAQFDAPPLEQRDFITGEIVKIAGVKNLDELKKRPGIDITAKVKEKVKQEEAKYAKGRDEFSYSYNRALFYFDFKKNGDLDFKNQPDIASPNAKDSGYTEYKIFNGNLVQLPDLGNMVFGDFSRKYMHYDLGDPKENTDPLIGLEKLSVYGIGNWAAQRDWNENDRKRDQKALKRGYECGLKTKCD
ncbi:MAG: hypothetical protein HS115_15630 [Spirochaetales bacterium]|nr:hypothetical protein [Spirochaetales bacterium]